MGIISGWKNTTRKDWKDLEPTRYLYTYNRRWLCYGRVVRHEQKDIYGYSYNDVIAYAKALLQEECNKQNIPYSQVKEEIMKENEDFFETTKRIFEACEAYKDWERLSPIFRLLRIPAKA